MYLIADLERLIENLSMNLDYILLEARYYGDSAISPTWQSPLTSGGCGAPPAKILFSML
jgi:hypothetical protein